MGRVVFVLATCAWGRLSFKKHSSTRVCVQGRVLRGLTSGETVPVAHWKPPGHWWQSSTAAAPLLFRYVPAGQSVGPSRVRQNWPAGHGYWVKSPIPCQNIFCLFFQAEHKVCGVGWGGVCLRVYVSSLKKKYGWISRSMHVYAQIWNDGQCNTRIIIKKKYISTVIIINKSAEVTTDIYAYLQQFCPKKKGTVGITGLYVV